MGLSRYKKAPLELFWYYYLIQLIGHFPVFTRVEVAVSVVDKHVPISRASRFSEKPLFFFCFFVPV